MSVILARVLLGILTKDLVSGENLGIGVDASEDREHLSPSSVSPSSSWRANALSLLLYVRGTVKYRSF